MIRPFVPSFARRLACSFGAVCALAILGAAPAQAADYPTKPIRLINPWSPGGPTDLLARPLADKLGERLGQPVVVENRAGANGTIGAAAVARAAPDGYTIFLSHVGPNAIAPAMTPPPPYDPIKDFVPITQLVSGTIVLVARPDLPASTLPELIEYARANPGKLTYGSVGPGSTSHLAGHMLAEATGIDMVHVPYKGSSQINTDILGGHLSMAFVGVAGVVQLVNSGQMRALAVSTSSRSSLFPDVPAVNELVPGFDVDSWYGLMAPAGTPQPIIDRLAKEASAVLADPQLAKIYRDNGLEPEGTTPAEYTEKIASELTRWKAVIDSAGLGQ